MRGFWYRSLSEKSWKIESHDQEERAAEGKQIRSQLHSWDWVEDDLDPSQDDLSPKDHENEANEQKNPVSHQFTPLKSI